MAWLYVPHPDYVNTCPGNNCQFSQWKRQVLKLGFVTIHMLPPLQKDNVTVPLAEHLGTLQACVCGWNQALSPPLPPQAWEQGLERQRERDLTLYTIDIVLPQNQIIRKGQNAQSSLTPPLHSTIIPNTPFTFYKNHKRPACLASFNSSPEIFEFGRHLCVPGITSGRAISFYNKPWPSFPIKHLGIFMRKVLV